MQNLSQQQISTVASYSCVRKMWLENCTYTLFLVMEVYFFSFFFKSII